MKEQTRILLIEEDLGRSRDLRADAGDLFSFQVEPSAEHAINRIGLEDFDLVVLDTGKSGDLITNHLIQFFRKIHVPIMFLGRKPASANGYPCLSWQEHSRFADKVQELLGTVHT